MHGALGESDNISFRHWREGGISEQALWQFLLTGEFDAAVENWSSYLERLNHFLAANMVEDEQKKDAFLCCIGRDSYGLRLLRALMAPNKSAVCTYQQLTDALIVHFVPKPVVIAERFRFHKRNQMEGETIKLYVAA